MNPLPQLKELNAEASALRAENERLRAENAKLTYEAGEPVIKIPCEQCELLLEAIEAISPGFLQLLADIAGKFMPAQPTEAAQR